MSERTRTVEEVRADIARLAEELDQRLDEHEAATVADEWGRRARLLRLEAAYLLSGDVRREDRPGGGAGAFFRGLGDFLLKAAPVATSVWVALVAYFVNDKVEQALEVRRVEVAEGELDLATIQAIEDELSALREPNISTEEAEQTAMRIAAFGSRALLPLVMELDLDRNLEPKRAQALENALRMMALVDYQRERLCAILAEAIEIDAAGNLFQRDGRAMVLELAEAIPCADVEEPDADDAARSD